jgi:hypothetical protein
MEARFAKVAGRAQVRCYPASVNDRALTTGGVPRPGAAGAPRTVAQAASFSMAAGGRFC